MNLWPLFLLAATVPPAADKIVFDTDCGFFGDDGAALAMVLRSPEKVQVAAITAVSGNVWAAESAGYLTEILGLLGHPEIKPHVGAQMPFIHTADMAKLEAPLEFQGAFGNPVKLAPPGQPAALDALAAAVRQSPGRITILALGPMTNVAMGPSASIVIRPGLCRTAAASASSAAGCPGGASLTGLPKAP